jgi:methylase of polypeptide subunit release factors
VQLPSTTFDHYTASLYWGSSDQEKGEVFTKPDIVQFMLISSGVIQDLFKPTTRILEPSCGQGEFVIAVAKRLVELTQQEVGRLAYVDIINLITAYDISLSNIEIAKKNTQQVLLQIYSAVEAQSIVSEWFYHGDFLLTEFEISFSHVMGNPPYIRIENIPPTILASYRKRFSTMKDRADIYVAFYQKSLELLSNKGKLTYICTDRWTKNRYGSSLRAFISNDYQLDLYIDLYGKEAFQSDVLTYPAITQISKRKQSSTLIVHRPVFNINLANSVLRILENKDQPDAGMQIRKDIVDNQKPWLFGNADELALIKRLEDTFPTLAEVGCQVFIGAATGNNKVYIVDKNIELEPCRKLPVITASDIRTGELIPSGNFIINTYGDNGLIDLEDFPLLQRYLGNYEDVLRTRHAAKQTPVKWFKTIDKIHPARAAQEKLLIPDIKSTLMAVYDSGEFHPNNSIYYIITSDWDIRALQAVLMSGVGQMFVAMYSTKVSGGNLRFQAQHLRRIRLPRWEEVPLDMAEALRIAAITNDVERAKELTAELYNFNEQETQLLG